MWFRGRQPETSVWKRFRSAADGFVFSKEEEYYSAHVVAHAERIVDLLLALMEQLPPAAATSVLMRVSASRTSGSGRRSPRHFRLVRASTIATSIAGGSCSISANNRSTMRSACATTCAL